MTKDAVPFHRPFAVIQMKAGGVDVTVEANDIERATIAADFGLPEIRSLIGTYRLTGRPERIKVTGRIRADIQQICVVSLEPFDSVLEENVELLFADEKHRRASSDLDESAEDMPDPIVNGQIDLGAVTAEFMALGLDPYPRKPGVSFEDVRKALGLPDEPGA